jgi:hypothetical protein
MPTAGMTARSSDALRAARDRRIDVTPRYIDAARPITRILLRRASRTGRCSRSSTKIRIPLRFVYTPRTGTDHRSSR